MSVEKFCNDRNNNDFYLNDESSLTSLINIFIKT